jgi:hypothetical protein
LHSVRYCLQALVDKPLCHFRGHVTRTILFQPVLVGLKLYLAGVDEMLATQRMGFERSDSNPPAPQRAAFRQFAYLKIPSHSIAVL